MGRTPKRKDLSHVMLERLMHYYFFVEEHSHRKTDGMVTSREIASLMHVDDTLVRKDLAIIGVRGYVGFGFRAKEVLSAIRKTLGFDVGIRAVIIGTGRLGGALAAYPGFPPFGLEIAGVFDNDPGKRGMVVSRFTVRPMDELPEVVRTRNVSVAILAVPSEIAQDVAEQAVAAGVKALWNFASPALVLPPNILVRHEHLSVGLAELSYEIKRRRDTGGRGGEA